MKAERGPAGSEAAEPRVRLVAVQSVWPGLGADAVAMPSEEVLLARVALPLASRRQRQAAAGFAVEDLIAAPLEASHVALGPELAPGEYLVAVVGDAAMSAWAARTDAARPRLAPDVLALPVPVAGCASVWEEDGRVLVRRADGTGFATRAASFAAFWRAEGSPGIVLFGGRLPDGIPVRATELLPAATPEALSFDLMRGAYARNSGDGRRALSRLALIVALALTAHGAILGLETLALQRIAGEREATLRAALATRLPDLPQTAPLDVALRAAMPPEAAAGGGGFLPLLARVSEALLPEAQDADLLDLAYDASDGALAFRVVAPDLAALQRVETRLRGAGLTVSSGVATSAGDTAEARFVVGRIGG